MQSRNASNHNRIILIGCFLLLLITGVLYFVKRIEANRLHLELSSTKVEKKEREEDLSTKLTDYLQKMEEMTRQLGDLQSKLLSCEDAKGKAMAEAKTAKNAVEECHQQQSQHVLRQGDLEDELNDLRAECQTANEKAKSHLNSLSQLQQSAKASELELDSCQTQASQCQTTLTGMQGEMVQLRARCNQQQQQQQLPVQQQQLQQLPVQQQQMVQQPAQQLGQNVLSNNGYKQKIQVPNQFQNHVPNVIPSRQQQPVIHEQVDEQKEPSYPEEEEEEEDNGDPLSDGEDQGGDGEKFNTDDEGPVQDEAEEDKDLFDEGAG